MNDNFEFHVTIMNQDEKLDFNESWLTFRDPSEFLFYNAKIKVPYMSSLNNEGYTFNMTLKSRKVSSFTKIPEFFYLVLNQGDYEIIYETKVKIQWFGLFLNSDYMKEKIGCLLDYIQVLVYGIAGSGKSTTINTQYSSISDHVRSVVAHRRGEGHQTKKIGPCMR